MKERNNLNITITKGALFSENKLEITFTTVSPIGTITNI